MALLKIIDANSVPGVSATLGGVANRVVGASLNGIAELQRMGVVGTHTLDSPTLGYMGVPHIDDYSIGVGKERRQMIAFTRSTLAGRNYLRFPVTWTGSKRITIVVGRPLWAGTFDGQEASGFELPAL